MFTAPVGNDPFPTTFGDLTIDFSVPTAVTTLAFGYFPPDSQDRSNDFAVRNVTVTGGQVDTHNLDAPEPATLVLLGSGLLFIARTRRRTR